MKSQENSSPLLSGVIGGVVGAVVAVILSDDTRRRKVLSIVKDFKDRAIESLGEVEPEMAKKTKKVLNAGK